MTTPLSSSQNVDEPFDPVTCEEKIKATGLQPPCPQEPCEEFMETGVYHEGCVGRAMYSPVLAIGCYNTQTSEWRFAAPKETLEMCEKLASEDQSWQISECYCCCKCSPNETLIGLPEGHWRPIFQIGNGDSLLAGRVGPLGAIEWKAAVVGFSQGTDGGETEAMVHIVYGGGRKMVASTDQPLMLADGSLTTASRVVPGRDRLMGVEGEQLDVTYAGLGEREDVAYYLATQESWSGSIDDHLIQADGVVAGDFTLQVHFAEVPEEQRVPGWSSLPRIGTPEYEQANPQLRRLRDSHAYAAP
jgi:hypothetical protein